MDNNYEQEKTLNWEEEIDNEIEETLEKDYRYSFTYLKFRDISLRDIDRHMLDKFEREFPSVIPSKIYSHVGLTTLANDANFHPEMPQDLKTQPLYFIIRGDNVVAFLPLENIEEDRIDCYFFHRSSFQDNGILREKYAEVLYKLNKD